MMMTMIQFTSVLCWLCSAVVSSNASPSLACCWTNSSRPRLWERGVVQVLCNAPYWCNVSVRSVIQGLRSAHSKIGFFGGVAFSLKCKRGICETRENKTWTVKKFNCMTGVREDVNEVCITIPLGCSIEGKLAPFPTTGCSIASDRSRRICKLYCWPWCSGRNWTWLVVVQWALPKVCILVSFSNKYCIVGWIVSMSAPLPCSISIPVKHLSGLTTSGNTLCILFGNDNCW